VAAGGKACLGAQAVVQHGGGAAGVPAPVEPIHGAPGWEVDGQGPPDAAVVGQVADRIDDVAPMVCLGPAAALARGRWWQQRLEQRPFGIGGVGRVASGAMGGCRWRRCGAAAGAADWHAGSWGDGLVRLPPLAGTDGINRLRYVRANGDHQRNPNQGSRALRLRRLARPVAPPAQVQQVYHQVIASSRTRQQSAHPRTE
jgi:hypothetical protein